MLCSSNQTEEKLYYIFECSFSQINVNYIVRNILKADQVGLDKNGKTFWITGRMANILPAGIVQILC